MPRKTAAFAALMTFHTLISAGTFLVGKAAAVAFPTLVLGLFRYLLAAAGFVVLAAILGQGSALRSAWRADARGFLAAGFLGVTLNQVAFLGGLRFTLPAHAALLYALTPTFVLALAWIRGQERPTGRKLLGLALAFAGVAVLFRDKVASGLPPHWLRGDLMILAAVLAWAGYTVLSRPLVQRHGALPATALSILAGTALFLPLGLWGLRGFAPAGIGPQAWGGVLYLALMTSVLSYLVWFQALRLREPSRVAIATNGQPIATALLGWAFLHQPLTVPFLGGAGLVAAGVLLTQT